jgi:hypothetical protein
MLPARLAELAEEFADLPGVPESARSGQDPST